MQRGICSWIEIVRTKADMSKTMPNHGGIFSNEFQNEHVPQRTGRWLECGHTAHHLGKLSFRFTVHEWIDIDTYAVFKTTVKRIYISDYLLLMTVLLWIMYWDWVSSQWTPQTCGTQLEGSCLPFAYSTVWFGEAVSALLLATLVRITITLTLMVFLTFIKWQKSELQRCHVLFVCGPAVTSLK